MGKKKKQNKVEAETIGDIWVIAAKLHGIGELIKYRDCDPPLNQADVNYGIGQVITDLAQELEAIRDQLQSRL